MRPFLPYGKQSITEADVQSVVRALKGDYLTTGPQVTAFEDALGAYVGAPYVSAVSNGTAALHLAMLALKVEAGDWVIVPDTTFLATANAVRFCGADVIFGDVDPDTGLMTPELLSAAIEKHRDKRVVGVIPVHLAGQCTDMLKISSVAKEQGMWVVEDACHAIGAAYLPSGRKIGSCCFSDITVFSFHPVKTIAMGEGGALCTSSPELDVSIKKFRSHGMEHDPNVFIDGCAPNYPGFYQMQELGFNYRITDIQCALGLSQLQRVDEFVEARSLLMSRYEHLLPVEGVSLLSRTSTCIPAWHLCVALVNFEIIGKSRAEFMGELRGEGVGTQVHYIPVSSQPYYQERYQYPPNPGAVQYYNRALSLPLYPSMVLDDVDYVIDRIKSKCLTKSL